MIGRNVNEEENHDHSSISGSTGSCCRRLSPLLRQDAFWSQLFPLSCGIVPHEEVKQMAISLSEQLESDIKAYLHKTFGTYFSSLDERFAADIKDDVISASDFNHGYYNDDDISIAFQRVTLGRMRHPDWQIYHSCTDSEVNTMKQNVKVNTPIHIRPASPEEAGLFYSELEEAADKKLGTVGHVRMDFGSSGKGFHHSWWPHNGDRFNTD